MIDELNYAGNSNYLSGVWMASYCSLAVKFLLIGENHDYM